MRMRKLIAGGLTAAVLGSVSLLASAPTSADVITAMEPPPNAAEQFERFLAPPTNVRMRVIQHEVNVYDGYFSEVAYIHEGFLSWDAVAGIDKYNIYKNGSYLTTVRGTTYFMRGVPDTTARWTVVSVDDDTNRFSPQSEPAAKRFSSWF